VVTSTDSREEYLEAIFKLSPSAKGATVGGLARELGVKPASASQMVGRLLADGLLKRDKRNRVVLTDSGREQALGVVRRHRLSERFLTDCLGLPWDQVHEEACKLEHALSEQVEASLTERLGRPRTCPHGRPIPYDSDAETQEATLTLADLGEGKSGTVSHVPEDSPELLRFLASLGLVPGARVSVADVQPFDGPMTVVVGRQRQAVGRGLARNVFVWPTHGDDADRVDSRSR
jgi:DtxR family transcriptional regulator, Mn-dependent transcriptional regulator